MTKEVYTIRDNKVEVYNQPFMVISREQVERDMLMIVNDPDHTLSIRAEDYSLYELGSFDDSTGMYNLYDAPKHILNLVDLKKG